MSSGWIIAYSRNLPVNAGLCPPRVYAGPPEIYVGQALTADKTEKLLLKSGYRKVSGVRQSGAYKRAAALCGVQAA